MNNSPHLATFPKSSGVILNAYPDSIGSNLAGLIDMLQRPEFNDTFSQLYLLPTFFNSDLDRGFSIIDYDLNREFVSIDDLQILKQMKYTLKLDLVLNHLSVNSPQFQDLLARGDASAYRDFFIDWNHFWRDQSTINPAGYAVPKPEYLNKLFMRKPALPVMKITFPNEQDHFFWNTFYQEIQFSTLKYLDLLSLPGITVNNAREIAGIVNEALGKKLQPEQIELGPFERYRERIMAILNRKKVYKGQIDLNARSEKVWLYYEETMKKLHSYGATIVRLDAFAYLHKEPGRTNFFNRPETWHYLERIQKIARHNGLSILPEIHAEYGSGLHEDIAEKGYLIYDFFLPALLIHSLENKNCSQLIRWIKEIEDKKIRVINMLGCHDGIPVMDLKGAEREGLRTPGLLTDDQIDKVINLIIDRGGLIKELYAPDGAKIAYYQVNATFFSALGEDEGQLLLARAVQLFMPGLPQVWYLDLFAGVNDYAAVKAAGAAGHKEINRTNLSTADIEKGLKKSVVIDQLTMIRFRSTSPVFKGSLEVIDLREPHLLKLTWRFREYSATLSANFIDNSFIIKQQTGSTVNEILSRR